jgi:hypothetical protein
VVRRGSGVLSPATHAHRLFSYLLSGDTTRIQHNIHGRPIRPGFEPCRPRGGVGRNTHTHLWPSGGSFLGKNPPPSVRFDPLAPGPRPRSTVSDSHAATELPYFTTFKNCVSFPFSPFLSQKFQAYTFQNKQREKCELSPNFHLLEKCNYCSVSARGACQPRQFPDC